MPSTIAGGRAKKFAHLSTAFYKLSFSFLAAICLNLATFTAEAADVALVTWSVLTPDTAPTRTYNADTPLPSSFSSAVITNIGNTAKVDTWAFVIGPFSATQYHELQFTTIASVTLSGLRFQHYHNHSIAGDYSVQLEFSGDGGATWEAIGPSIAMSTANSGTTDTVSFSKTLAAGSYQIRWLMVGAGNTDTDFFGFPDGGVALLTPAPPAVSAPLLNFDKPAVVYGKEISLAE